MGSAQVIKAIWPAKLAILVGVAGCGGGGGEIQKAIQQAQKQVEQATGGVTSVVQTAATAINRPAESYMDISFDPPIKTQWVFVEHCAMSDRPSVIQVRTYKNRDEMKFPSVLIQFEAPEKTIAEMEGKEYSATVFVQSRPFNPPHDTDVDKQVKVQVVAGDDSYIDFKIVSGQVVNTDTGAKLPLIGRVGALFNKNAEGAYLKSGAPRPELEPDRKIISD